MAEVLEDRVALVTGGAARLGAEICRSLARAGAIVAVHCHRSLAAAEDLVEEIEADGGEAFVVRGDLAQDEDRSALVEAVIDRAGRLDILVNNASIFERIPLEEMTSDAANMMWKINAEAPLMLIQHAASHLRFEGVNKPGSVINIIDNASGRNDWPNHSHYCASKAALLSLTRSLAQELAPSIRINAIGPGAILFQDWESDERKAAVLSSIPMQRVGNAEEIAETVLFLVAGPTYITGQIIDVDGGWSLS
ncbi:MAG TPA: SDR family oxidoreductase [Candidatus Thalassarchaeaceae archaeon]|jgi:NAD(P)-dependent dehydrogenase (short-subunit alcohol dehydrogenase family)|nr:SDR family oxidoreductase [Candidatus Thalassarchaeaceae archaeon]